MSTMKDEKRVRELLPLLADGELSEHEEALVRRIMEHDPALKRDCQTAHVQAAYKRGHRRFFLVGELYDLLHFVYFIGHHDHSGLSRFAFR